MSESTQNGSEFWDDLAGIVDGDEELIAKHAELLGTSTSTGTPAVCSSTPWRTRR